MSAAARLPDSIQSLPDALAFWAEWTPSAPALIAPGTDPPVLTYAALWRAAQELASSLNHAGIGRHDRVVLLVPDGRELAVALLGTMTAAIAVPLEASHTAAELEDALHGLNASGAIVTAPLPDAARTRLSRDGVPAWDLRWNEALAGLALTGEVTRPPRHGVAACAEDIAFVIQTSGTTGTPKRVPISHGSIPRDGRAHRDRFGLHRWDRALAVAPLTTSLGITSLVHGIGAGAALVFPSSSDLATVWATMRKERPTWMLASGGFLELLTRFLRGRPPVDRTRTFRFVRVTASPIAPEICDELASRLGAPVLPSYSSSEAALVATAMPPPARNKPGSVGLPIQDVRIVGADGNDVPPGAEGEIWIRGPKLFSGYLDDSALNAAAFQPGGWFRSGDVGSVDGDGFLYVKGRISDIVNRGGNKISPAEVDSVLHRHPAVAAAAAFAVRDARLGEDIVAAVVLHQGEAASPRELRGWMLDSLTPAKVPRRIWYRETLPRTATGKVQRGELARLWREQHG